jgi:hypothetical protein
MAADRAAAAGGKVNSRLLRQHGNPLQRSFPRRHPRISQNLILQSGNADADHRI